MTEVTVIESLGYSSDTFQCVLCGATRRYYDLLNDDRMICLECSVKGEYAQDIHVVIHAREPSALATDPELVQIRNALVQWELDKDSVKLDDLHVPTEVGQRLLELVTNEGTTLDVVVTAALRMLFSAYDSKQLSETMPVLPEQVVDGQ